MNLCVCACVRVCTCLCFDLLCFSCLQTDPDVVILGWGLGVCDTEQELGSFFLDIFNVRLLVLGFVASQF